MYTVSLTPAQQQELRRYRDSGPKPYQRERAAALLKIAAGASATAVPRTRWTLAELALAGDFLGPITLPGLSQLLGRVGIHYKAARDYIHSPDPDYLDKLAYIAQRLAGARGSDGRRVLLYQDELTYYRQPSLARAYEARGRRQPLAVRSHAANTATRAAATLDPFTGRVVPWQG